MKEIRVGFLGAGGIADSHARAVTKVPGVKVVGICNRNVARAEELSVRRSLGAKCFGDFDQMLASVPMDVLYVCLAPGAHNGQTEKAAARGLHLFLEKPIALTVERARSIGQAVKAAGVKCQIGHHLRHVSPVIKLKQMIADGSAGRPLLFQGRWICNALHPAWWRDPLMGGGQLLEQAIHVYDLARYFLGDADVATGFAGKLAHERFADYQVDDTAVSAIRFKSGAMASICSSNCAIPGEWTHGVTVICEKVTVEMPFPKDGGSFYVHGGKVADELKGAKVAAEEVKNTLDCADEISRNFIAAIRGEEALRSGIDDGVKGLELVAAVGASSANGGSPQKLA